MYKKGTLNLFERDYKERTGLKRGEKGKTNSKRVRLARDLKKIRKGEGGKALPGPDGLGLVTKNNFMNRMAPKSEISQDIGRGKYAKTRSTKKDRDRVGIHAIDSNNRWRKGVRVDGKTDSGRRAYVDREATRISGELAGKAEKSNQRRKRTKK